MAPSMYIALAQPTETVVTLNSGTGYGGQRLIVQTAPPQQYVPNVQPQYAPAPQPQYMPVQPQYLVQESMGPQIGPQLALAPGNQSLQSMQLIRTPAGAIIHTPSRHAGIP